MTYLLVCVLFICIFTQETVELLCEVNRLACETTSERQTKLIGLLLECHFVELVQKMWQKYLRPELLEKDGDLPQHVHASLNVGPNTRAFCTIL